MAEPYRSQTNPGGSTALSGADPDAFGAAIGRGLVNAGGEAKEIGARLEREDELRKARERQEQNAAAAIAYATLEATLGKAEIDGRASMQPGAAGHSAAIGKLADDEITKALGGVKDPEVRKSWEARFTDLRGRTFNNAYAFERVEATKKMVGDAGDAVTIMTNGQVMNPNVTGAWASSDTIETMYNNFDLPPDLKKKGIKDAQRTLWRGFIQGMIERDPAAVLQGEKEGSPGYLDAVKNFLEPEDLESLTDTAQAELARLQLLEKATKNAEERKNRDWIQSLGTRITSQGDWSVKDEDLARAQALATEYGDQSLVENIKGWRSLRSVTLETRDYTPADWAREISAIQKIEPEKRTQAQGLRLKHLEQLRGPAEARMQANPERVGETVGDPAPPIDWDNPTAAQGQERARWNARNRGRGAGEALLLKEDVARFQERIRNGGLAGELQTARIMRNTFGAADGTRALRQIAPSNPRLQLMVAMTPETAEDYRLGTDAMTRNDKIAPKDAAQEIFAEYRNAIPKGMEGPIYDAARAIAAGELHKAGNLDPSEREYRTAFMKGLHRSVGAADNKGGGFARWGDTPILIPPDMQKDEALRRLSRAAGDPVLVASKAGPPYYLDGQGRRVRYDAAGTARLLREGTLQSVAPGVFRVMLDDGGHVVTKDGAYWQIDLRKLK